MTKMGWIFLPAQGCFVQLGYQDEHFAVGSETAIMSAEDTMSI